MNRSRFLVVASNGGHLIQLLRLKPVFDKFNCIFVSTSPSPPKGINICDYHCVTDSNFNTKFKLLITFFQTFWLLIRLKPDFIITTGAAPGLFFILLGKFLGKKTIWIDSIANSSSISLSGKVASYFATYCVTQWSDLSTEKIKYIGQVI
jgi:UDP-N-acetylglucosamine:LPS N-acetylglucosamine transferase